MRNSDKLLCIRDSVIDDLRTGNLTSGDLSEIRSFIFELIWIISNRDLYEKKDV